MCETKCDYTLGCEENLKSSEVQNVVRNWNGKDWCEVDEIRKGFIFCSFPTETETRVMEGCEKGKW